MAAVERVSIGFSGGQVVEVRLDATESDGSSARRSTRRDGWHDLETEDGTVSLDLRQVVFVRSAARPRQHRLRPG